MQRRDERRDQSDALRDEAAAELVDEQGGQKRDDDLRDADADP
jgi:hypothetical protein